jgi:hypothetical protein
MKVISRTALGCTLVSLISFALASQSARTAISVPQAPRMTNVNGVESIAGQPFSADFDTERTQTLLDGSHIHTVQHQKFYRDGEGRIREEMFTRQGLYYQEGPGVLTSVMITDVVANVRYNLQLRNHAAQRSVVFVERVQAPTVPRPVPTPAQQAQPQPKGTNEPLGIQTIEGISAEGSRFTMTLPINAQGNDAPLTYSTEAWYSSEMGLQILQRMNDPRMGETVRHFTNIQRDEPDPSLFKVPADYTIKDPQ